MKYNKLSLLAVLVIQFLGFINCASFMHRNTNYWNDDYEVYVEKIGTMEEVIQYAKIRIIEAGLGEYIYRKTIIIDGELKDQIIESETKGYVYDFTISDLQTDTETDKDGIKKVTEYYIAKGKVSRKEIQNTIEQSPSRFSDEEGVVYGGGGGGGMSGEEAQGVRASFKSDRDEYFKIYGSIPTAFVNSYPSKLFGSGPNSVAGKIGNIANKIQNYKASGGQKLRIDHLRSKHNFGNFNGLKSHLKFSPSNHGGKGVKFSNPFRGGGGSSRRFHR